MKKAMFLLIIFLGFNAALRAQEARPVSFLNTGDTLVNTDTSYHSLSNIGFYTAIRVSYGVNKVNGTVAGTAQLQGCTDESKTRWFNLDTALTFNNVAVNQQSTLIDPSSWRHLRVRYITSGTTTVVSVTDGLLIRNSRRE